MDYQSGIKRPAVSSGYENRRVSVCKKSAGRRGISFLLAGSAAGVDPQF